MRYRFAYLYRKSDYTLVTTVQQDEPLILECILTDTQLGTNFSRSTFIRDAKILREYQDGCLLISRRSYNSILLIIPEISPIFNYYTSRQIPQEALYNYHDIDDYITGYVNALDENYLKQSRGYK